MKLHAIFEIAENQEAWFRDRLPRLREEISHGGLTIDITGRPEVAPVVVESATPEPSPEDVPVAEPEALVETQPVEMDEVLVEAVPVEPALPEPLQEDVPVEDIQIVETEASPEIAAEAAQVEPAVEADQSADSGAREETSDDSVIVPQGE